MKNRPIVTRPVSPPSLVFCLNSEIGESVRPVGSSSNLLSQVKEIPSGETIFSAGQLTEVLHIVRLGRASLTSASPSGQDQFIRYSFHNEIFGITEFLGETPFEYDLVASTPCTVDQIDRRDIEDLLLADGRSLSHVIRALSYGIHLCHIVAREL